MDPATSVAYVPLQEIVIHRPVDITSLIPAASAGGPPPNPPPEFIQIPRNDEREQFEQRLKEEIDRILHPLPLPEINRWTLPEMPELQILVQNIQMPQVEPLELQEDGATQANRINQFVIAGAGLLVSGALLARQLM